MLSSADLHLERILLLTALTIFFGAGFSCMLIIFIINSVKKKQKSGLYYLLWFLIPGITVLALATLYLCMMLI